MQRRTTDLKPHPMNRKLYGDEAPSADFIESVRRHGIMVPLAIKEDGTIISGHRRWQAALALGMETVPVQIVDYADDLDEREAIIEFNRQREKTFSQKMAEAEELEAVERERARRRMLATQNNKSGKAIAAVETFPPQELECSSRARGVCPPRWQRFHFGLLCAARAHGVCPLRKNCLNGLPPSENPS